MPAHQSIEPETLHKENPDDVLIQNAFEILPARIESDLVESVVQGWQLHERTAFDTAYREDSGFFVRRGVPLHLSFDAAGQISQFEMDLPEHYSPHKGQLLLTSRCLPRTVENRLRENFFPDVTALSEQDAACVADLLAKSPHYTWARIKSYMVRNDTKNYFFYRKVHEHVPGLMLIEIARQAMYHYFYSFNGYARGDVSVSISSLNVIFSSYVESAYEVEVVVSDAEELARDKPRFVDMLASFYQNSRLVAKVRLRGGVMKIPLFRRMRVLNFPDHHWFIPSERISPHVLIGVSTGLPIHARLSMLSVRAIKLSVDATHLRTIKAARHITLSIEGVGFLCLPVLPAESMSEHGILLLEIDGASRDQMAALKEAIKCHCFFAEHADRPSKVAQEKFVPVRHYTKEAA